jgi:hypothetical protein
MARRGYRFIAEVRSADRSKLAEPVIVISNPQLEPVPRRAWWQGWRWLIVTAALTAIGLMIGAGAVYYRRGAEQLPYGQRIRSV